MAFICAKLLFLVSTKVRNNVRLLDRRYSTFYRSQSDFIGFDRRTDTLCEDCNYHQGHTQKFITNKFFMYLVWKIFLTMQLPTLIQGGGLRVMVFNMTLNNISVISWRSVLLAEETGRPKENVRPVASHWQTLSHNVHCCIKYTPLWAGFETHNVSGDRHWLHR